MSTGRINSRLAEAKGSREAVCRARERRGSNNLDHSSVVRLILRKMDAQNSAFVFSIYFLFRSRF
jgi:hypothetical protein